VRASLAILLLLISAAAAAQESLGTLFHTPKERDLLERLRRGEKIEAAVVTRPDPTITGYVKRSDGKSTVFLDKQPFAVGNPKDNELIEPEVVQRFEPELPPPAPPQAPSADKREGPNVEEPGMMSKLKAAASSLRRKATEEEED
jgi:hypothetical protein